MVGSKWSPCSLRLEAACVIIQITLADSFFALLPFGLKFYIFFVRQDTATAKLAIQGLESEGYYSTLHYLNNFVIMHDVIWAVGNKGQMENYYFSFSYFAFFCNQSSFDGYEMAAFYVSIKVEVIILT